MKPITRHNILPLQTPIQHFNDCYLISSITALARSKTGQKVLSKNVSYNKNGFKVRFQKIDSNPRDYFVSKDEIQKLMKFDEFYNEINFHSEQNPIIKAIEIAMNKLIEEYPKKKPFVSKLVRSQEKFEYNKPSNFLEIFTGQKPITLNENSLRMNLQKDKDKAIELFEKIDKSDDFSFIAGTGLWGNGSVSALHCLVIEGVNTENRYLQLYDSRVQNSLKLTFDKTIEIFKFLTGYLH